MQKSESETGSESQGDLCVSKVPLFQGLTFDEQLDVASVAHPTSLDRSEQLYSAGGDVSQLMVVHTGRIKIYRTSPDGHEQLVRVLGPGDFIGESTFLTGSAPDHSAVALEESELCVFRHGDLGSLIDKHSSIGLRMLQGVSQRLAEAESRLSAAITSDVSSRLADYLLGLPLRSTDSQVSEIVLPLTKKDIASFLDTTPESLSRQLRALTEAGIIEQKNNSVIQINDFDALLGLTN